MIGTTVGHYRILEHVDQILQRIPEVSITSRRTGLQMGLAAVTEANNGDFTVRLKTDRDRSIDEVMADARAQIHARRAPGGVLRQRKFAADTGVENAYLDRPPHTRLVRVIRGVRDGCEAGCAGPRA